MQNIASTLTEMLKHENGSHAVQASGHVVVFDGATGAIYTAEMAERLARRWQESIARAEQFDGEARDYALGQAYSLACSATSAMHEDEVTAEVAEALREEAGLGEDERLTWGW